MPYELENKVVYIYFHCYYIFSVNRMEQNLKPWVLYRKMCLFNVYFEMDKNAFVGRPQPFIRNGRWKFEPATS